MLQRITLVGAVWLAAAAWCVPAFGLDDDDDVVGAVYTMTNAAGPNHVVVYHRLSDGTLNKVSRGPFSGLYSEVEVTPGANKDRPSAERVETPASAPP